MKKIAPFFAFIPSILAVLIYLNTLGHQYTQDDAIVITQNKLVKQGFSGWKDILNKDTFYGFFQKEGKDKLVVGGRYRPLTLLQFSLGWQLFGNQPFFFHLLNIFWYAFLAWVVYITLSSLLFMKYTKEQSANIAFVATLIFVAHPLHTEVVANIKGRDEIMALLFSMGALYFFIKYYSDKKIGGLILSGVLLFLGLFAKENTITFLGIIPFAILLFASKIDWKRLLLGQGIIVVSALLFLIKRFQVLGMSMGKPTLEMMNNPFVKVEGGQYLPFDFSEKLATILYSLGLYLKLLIYPHTLTHDYYPRVLEVMQMSDYFVLLSLLSYILLICAAIYFGRRKPIICFSILLFVFSLSIVSNVVFPVGTHMSERFLFMPSVGFALLLSYFIYGISQRWPTYRHYIYLGLGILVGAYAYKTVDRNKAWKDNYTLFMTDVEVSSRSAKLQNSVGGVLIRKAHETDDKNAKKELLLKAQNHLNKALEIHPNYKNAYLLLGNSYVYLEDYTEGIKAYESALRLDSNYPEAFNNLAVTYRAYAKKLGEKGQIDKALKYLNQAIKLLPDDAESLRLLGVAYGSKGLHEKALIYFKKVTELTPNDSNAWQNLAIAYQYLGRTKDMEAAITRSKR